MLKQFKEMQKQMSGFQSGKMGKMMKRMAKMQGKVPNGQNDEAHDKNAG